MGAELNSVDGASVSIMEQRLRLYEFGKSFTAYRDEVYRYMADFFDQQKKIAANVDSTIEETIDVLSEFVLRGGKAVSPFLAKLAFEIGGGAAQSEQLLPIAAALELHHKYFLSLDDIVDRDALRYGGPTIEYRYRDRMEGQSDRNHRAMSLAMIESSLLLSFSRTLIATADFPAEARLRSLEIVHDRMSFDTLAGWKIHFYQNIETLAGSSVERFIKGLELVTAHYKFLGPMEIGLTLAGNTSPVLREAFEVYANRVGTAFQIYDDILGLFGDSDDTGKPVGNDVQEGKKTLLLQLAFEQANDQDRVFLQSKVGQPLSVSDVDLVRGIVIKTGSLDASKQMAKRYISEGIAALHVIPDCSQKNHLIALAEFVIARNK